MNKTHSQNSFNIFNNNDLLVCPGNEDEKYKAFIKNSVQAFFLTSANGTVLEINPAASTLFGYTPEEFAKMKTPRFIDNSNAAILPAGKSGQKNIFTVSEATGITKTGARFPIEVSTVYFTDKDGIGKYSTMVSDITLRKKAEADLQLSKDRYDLVVKATKELVWDWDLLTDEIYRSGHNLRDVYGHKSNITIKNISDWSAYIHPQDKERIKTQIDYYINSKEEKDFNLEYRFRKEDGNYVYINDKGYIIRNTEGKAIRMIGAAEDITERKKTALAIEESEMRYKMFVKQSTEGIWRVELKEPMHVYMPVENMITHCFKNAYIAECNDVFAKTYGFKNAGDIMGCSLLKILPDHNPLNIEYLLKFFKNGFRVQDEISYETDQHGNQLTFTNNMIGVIEGDYIRQAWGTQRDITHQKKAEKHLIERENHLKAIVDNDPECIKLLSKEGIILEMNPAGLQMIGAEKIDQVLGKNALSLILPEFRAEFKKILGNVFNGKAGKQVFKICGYHKKQLFLESHLVPLRNAAGHIIAALSVTRDITENKNAEALLQASEAKYRYLFNNNPASIIIWDIDTFEILEVNETAIELYGYPKCEFLQLSVLNLRAAEEQPAFMEFVKNSRILKLKKETFSWEHLTKKGTKVIMEITSHVITYKGRKAILALGNNISEKIQLENSLIEEREIRHQQITEAVIAGQEKERTELGQELHDNINQILASSKLYIECVMRDEKPRMDLMAESKSLIEKAMTELRNLSKSLLPPSLGETGLKQALIELIEHAEQANSLTINLDWKIADENKICKNLKLTIFRIAQEQLNNIIKHANAQNSVIKVEATDELITLSLTDDGLGFNTSLKRNGIGLRNITSRAEVNNGKISIISKPGEGCELIVKFPVKVHLQKTIINI